MNAPSYSTNDPKGWGGDPKRGAALGRRTLGAGREPQGRMTLAEVAIDSGGYDRNGTYFGTGAPLWWYADESGEIDGVLRAATRQAAEAEVRTLYPSATFGSATDDIDLDGFVQDYATAALWSSVDNADDSGGEPLDANYGPEDVDPATMASFRADCARFLRENAGDVGLAIEAGRTPGDVAHDLWLTRNGHGAGFWDRGLGALGERLSDAAHKLGAVDLYVVDGKVAT